MNHNLIQINQLIDSLILYILRYYYVVESKHNSKAQFKTLIRKEVCEEAITKFPLYNR